MRISDWSSDVCSSDLHAEQLEALRNKRMVFIFDECHRSQFGDNHQAIKDFFPKAQLFGFTGTPIFEDNASYKRIEGEEQTLKTTEDLFQQSLHEYTITHAIERSEEHTSDLQSLMRTSYAVFR